MTEGGGNLALAFFSWWYGEAYAKLFVFIKNFFVYLTDLFSVRLLFLTLFAPWKRDRLSTEGLSLQEKFQVWTFNLASRLIGLFVKLIILFVYVLVAKVCLALAGLAVVVWLAWPAISLWLIYTGLGG
ncbi:MAG: hypothetical protein AAB360_03090 [Patescibacteria group bacterium]